QGRMVSRRGLSPGLLGERGAAQPLLPRGDPAEAAEAEEELPGPSEERGGYGLVAARRRRSLIAAPRASSGIGATAMRGLDEESAWWSRSNKCAAASTRSPDGLRLASPEIGPKPIKYSSGAASLTLSRNGFAGA